LITCNSRQEVIDVLTDRLFTSDPEMTCWQDISFDICDMLASRFMTDSDLAPPRNMILRGRRGTTNYVIHNDDLLLAKTAVVAVLAFFTSDVQRAVTGVIGSLVLLTYTLHKKHIKISPTQAIVLKTVASRRAGATIEELTQLCSPILPAEEVISAAETMRRLPRADGTFTSLVEKDANGRLHAVDV
jgi:hypothetical protein